MQIDIFSDTICPWCYIGKRRLERALAARPQPGLEIRWRAFQLNPDMPPGGMDRKDYLAAKFGGAQGARQVYDRVRAAGESEGIAFAFEAIGRTPNTIDSHRLIRLAQDTDRADEVVEALFKAYFLRGEDIGDREILVAAAAAAGMDAQDVRTFLESDAGADSARTEDSRAREIGIQGVPTFILGGKYSLSGAHEPEVLFQLFDLGREEAESAAPASA
jgi:predicted DsbA family dithiol-disulfide isomerase